MNKQSKISILVLSLILISLIWYFNGREVYYMLGTLVQIDYYPPSLNPPAILVLTFNNKLPTQIIDDHTIVFIYSFSNTHDIVTTLLDSGATLYGTKISQSFMPDLVSDYQLGVNQVPSIIIEKYITSVSMPGYGTVGFKHI